LSFIAPSIGCYKSIVLKKKIKKKEIKVVGAFDDSDHPPEVGATTRKPD